MTTTTTNTPQPAMPSRLGDSSAAGVQGSPVSPSNESASPAPPPRRRRRPTDGSSARALAMLTRRPVFEAALPQLHVGGRVTDGSVLVDDRAAERRLRVYTPTLNSQFRAGYRAGLWYVRTPGDAEPSPRSAGYPTRAAALDSLRAVPRDRTSPRERTSPSARGPHCRVIWS